MIPAIDPGFGLKEDRPVPRTPPSGDDAFSHVLHRTVEPERRDSERPNRDDGASGDPRSREVYGRHRDDAAGTRQADTQRADRGHAGQAADRNRTDRADDTPDKSQGAHSGASTGKTATAHAGKDADQAADAKPGKGGKDADAKAKASAEALQTAAAQALNPAAQGPATAQTVLAQGPQPPDTEGHILTDKTVPTRFAGIDDATPINALIGLSAYKLGPHGKDEAQRAQAQGVELPGTAKAQLTDEGVASAKQMALQQAQVSTVQAKTDGAAAGLAGIVQPTPAGHADKPGGLSYKEQIALQTAQARNEVLSRLAATGAEGAGQNAGQGLGQGLAHGNPDTLRQQLQLHGLLARDARLHTLEPTSPNAPQTAVAGLATAPNSVPVPQPPAHDDAAAQHTIDKVATEARWLINNNRQEVTLRLSPDHLGNLHLKVQHEDGVFHVHLTVDSSAAKHLLESNLQELRNQLSGDHPGGQFYFNVDVRHGNDQPSLYQRSGRPAIAGVGHAGGLEQASAPGLARRYTAGQSGLSIYV